MGWIDMTALDLAAKKYDEEVARLRVEAKANWPRVRELIAELESLRRIWAPEEKPWRSNGPNRITDGSGCGASIYLSADDEWWEQSELGAIKLGKTADEVAVKYYEHCIRKVALDQVLREEGM